MTVVPFPQPRPAAQPKLDLLSQVFAAMTRHGGPVSAEDLTARICGEHAERERIHEEVAAILQFYSRTPLVELGGGCVFARVGGRFAYTDEIRAFMARQGCQLLQAAPSNDEAAILPGRASG